MSTPEYLAVAECAARLRVSPSLVRQRIRAGVIPTSPLTGRAIRIPASALDAATTQQQQSTQPIGRRVKVELPKGYRRLMG